MKKLLFAFFAFLLCLTPVQAENNQWVVDEEDILTTSEENALSQRIDSLVSQYDMGIYIRIMEDMESYSDIEDYSEYLYTYESMGIGAEKSGILLVMEFSDRNFDILAYGNGNTAFTDYGKMHLQTLMLADFSDGDWYGGLDSYLDGVQMELREYTNGRPYDNYGTYEEEESNMPLIITIVAPPLIALLICLALISRHRTAAEASYASAYIKGNGLNLTRRFDRYTHTTRTVTHIPRNDDHGGGGGTSINSGGFSHSSGKF